MRPTTGALATVFALVCACRLTDPDPGLAVQVDDATLRSMELTTHESGWFRQFLRPPKPISGKVTANRPTGISRDVAEAARNTAESGWPRRYSGTIVTRSLLACCMRRDMGCERLLREPTSRLRVTPESQEA
jgi:hypothetical protein